MKKISTLIIALLLGWSGFLSYQVFDLRSKLANYAGERVVVDATVTRISTDLTKLVDTCGAKTVAVVTYRNNQLTTFGSGVIYQAGPEKVLIVTNYHIIENTSSYKVRFASGQQLDATLVGYDSLSDIAVLSVAVDFNVAAFKLGDSSLTTRGEYVVALGAPLNFDFKTSLTFGIISGKDWLIPVDLDKDGITDWDNLYLQTDATIDSGNSGGALVNMAGELIGINSKRAKDGSSDILWLVLPINEVVAIVEQIKENSIVLRVPLGIFALGIGSMSNMEKTFNGIDLASNSGIYVTAVVSASPADKAGIKPGDIVIKMGDVTIYDFKQYRSELYKLKADQIILIEIIRDGQKKTVEVQLPPR